MACTILLTADVDKQGEDVRVPGFSHRWKQCEKKMLSFFLFPSTATSTTTVAEMFSIIIESSHTRLIHRDNFWFLIFPLS